MEPKKISENVTLYSTDPIVYVVNNFLSDEECKAFVEMGKGKELELSQMKRVSFMQAELTTFAG